MSDRPIPSEVVACLPPDAWVVGGAIRDEFLGRPVVDIDLVVVGSPEAAAREFSSAVGKSAAFSLSDDFGAWRVVHHDERWQVDFSPMDGSSIEEDLSRRDLTINAMARSVSAMELIDPFGGAKDIEAGRLREVGPQSFESDPLRVLRLARFAVCLGFEASQATTSLASASAHKLVDVSGERAFMEFAQIISSGDPVRGIRLLKESNALNAVLPELLELDGVTQSSYHHLDCLEHTLLVLQDAVDLQLDPSPLGAAGQAAADVLDGHLGDGLSRWDGLRIAALVHDIAKARTRTVYDGGRIGFPGHDDLGAQMSETILARFRTSSKVSNAVCSMVSDHLRAGFLTHSAPLGKRETFDYLVACGSTAVEVTILSVADRLATRGRGSDEAISRHLALTEVLLEAAVEHELTGGLKPLIRGDELAEALGIAQGPQLGELLAELAAAQYAGVATTRAEALDHLRSRIEGM